jgi:predicted patatin/cPLA2 family phospholipase
MVKIIFPKKQRNNIINEENSSILDGKLKPNVVIEKTIQEKSQTELIVETQPQKELTKENVDNTVFFKNFNQRLLSQVDITNLKTKLQKVNDVTSSINLVCQLIFMTSMKFQIKNENLEVSIADIKIRLQNKGKQTKKDCSSKLFSELMERQPILKQLKEIISKKI